MNSAGSTNLHVSFHNVSSLKSAWKIFGLNLIMYKTSLPEINLTLKGSQKSGVVSLKGSNIGSLQVYGKFEINIINCIMNGDERRNITILDVVSCKVNIYNSTFIKNDGGNGVAIVKAKSSQVTIINVSFHQNHGHQGLIEVVENSNLLIINSTFYRNGYWFFALYTIVLRSGSEALVSSCVFTGNKAVYGAALCSFPRTSITVVNSTFTNNFGQQGALINIHDQPNLTMHYFSERTKFTHKQLFETRMKVKSCPVDTKPKSFESKHHSAEESALFKKDGFSCVINDSTFSNNRGVFRGGAIYVQGRTLFIYNTSFILNSAGFGAALAAQDNVMIFAKNTTFRNNYGFIGSQINAENSVYVYLKNILFDYNDTGKVTGVGFRIISHSSIRIFGSKFITNMPLPLDIENFTDITVADSDFRMYCDHGSGVIYAENNVKINFTRCSFFKNGGFQISDNTFLFMDHCSIVRSHHVASLFIVLIKFGSHFYLRDTNITATYPLQSIPFLRAESVSSVTLERCLYADSVILQYHFIIVGGSKMRVVDSLFINNKPNDDRGAYLWNFVDLIHVENSFLSVTGSAFLYNNIIPWFIGYPVESSILKAEDSKVNVTDTLFKHNNAHNVLYAGYQEDVPGPPGLYVQITNCTFNNNGSSISLFNIAEILLQKLVFQVNEENAYYPLLTAGPIRITKGKIVRISHSHFISNKKAPLSVEFIQYRFMNQRYHLKTLLTNFSDGSDCVLSNDSKFLAKAKAFGFILVDHEISVNEEETGFALSKYITRNV